MLPELSSHPVLHDLLRSFRLERPLPSSRFPSWDLLRVLSLLRESSLVLSGTLLARLSSFFLLPLLAVWVSSRLCLPLCLLPVVISFFLTFSSSGLNRNLLLIPCLVPSVSNLYGILWVPYLGSCLFVPSSRSRFIFAVLLLFLLVRGLFLSVLALLLVLFPKMLWASFSVVSFFSPSFLLPLLLLLLELIAFVACPLRLPSLAMFLLPLFLLPRLGVLLLYLLPSIYVMSSFLLLQGFP